MMKEFFDVTSVDEAIGFASRFSDIGTESVNLAHAGGRILGQEIAAEQDLPEFNRSTMDGYAVCAQSTFGASESNPAYLTIKGTVAMGEPPGFSVAVGDAARISTGGMMPEGADAVVMVEHTEVVGDDMIEVYKSVAPGRHVIEKGEDVRSGTKLLAPGRNLRPQEIGLLAGLGKTTVIVCKKPVVGIISTGNEIVPIDEKPGWGRIRDMNTYTLIALAEKEGAIARSYGIVEDDYHLLLKKCVQAASECDMVLISGGSSVGHRDYTIQVISGLEDAEILAHGVSISPGKPTIIADVRGRPFFGLPGHVTSAMIVFKMIVVPFIHQIIGLTSGKKKRLTVPAILNRNISSVQGRIDYVRVRLKMENETMLAEPIPGKSGLIRTMTDADGLIEIDLNAEGLEKGTRVAVIPF